MWVPPYYKKVEMKTKGEACACGAMEAIDEAMTTVITLNSGDKVNHHETFSDFIDSFNEISGTVSNLYVQGRKRHGCKCLFDPLVPHAWTKGSKEAICVPGRGCFLKPNVCHFEVGVSQKDCEYDLSFMKGSGIVKGFQDEQLDGLWKTTNGWKLIN
jgi:hypothetical protein